MITFKYDTNCPPLKQCTRIMCCYVHVVCHFMALTLNNIYYQHTSAYTHSLHTRQQEDQVHFG